MYSGMAVRAQGDQVRFGILAGMTSKMFVVNFQVRHRAAKLTSPAIATQNLLPQYFVRPRIQPHSRHFLAA
jgi:hypothetical protein